VQEIRGTGELKQEEFKELTTGLILERPATQLLDDFGAGQASPGSGSAAALLSILSAKKQKKGSCIL